MCDYQPLEPGIHQAAEWKASEKDVSGVIKMEQLSLKSVGNPYYEPSTICQG